VKRWRLLQEGALSNELQLASTSSENFKLLLEVRTPTKDWPRGRYVESQVTVIFETVRTEPIL
jgi:hypothetical protein